MGRNPDNNVSSGMRRHRRAAIAAVLAAALVWPMSAVLGNDNPGKSRLLTEVHFNPGSAEVTPGGLQKINQAIAKIQSENPLEIHVIGFADSTGDKSINREISRKRADNVARMLVQQGISLPLVIEGKGEEGAPYKIPDDVSEPLNRCVGIIAVGTQGAKPLL